MIKKLLIIGAIFLAIILQLSFISAVPYLRNINFIILIILYLSTKNDYFFVVAAIAGGILLDSFSSFIFGTHLLSFVFISLLANYICFKVLASHRFLPFMILIGAGIFLYHFSTWILVFSANFFKILPRAITLNMDFGGIFKEIAYSLVLLSAIYLVFKTFQKKLKTVFIPKNF